MSDRLVVDGLRVARGERVVVRDVGLELQRGRITALLGANGAGKSTFVLGVAGVLKPVAGSVRLGDTELRGKAAHKIRAAGVAAVPEGHRVLRGLTVEDNLAAAGSMLSRQDADQSVQDALQVFPELALRMEQEAGTLSGGQQQMLAVAQALVSRPAFLLADELSLGLAPIVLGRLVEAMRVIAAAGTGVLLIEQFTTIALELATDAYLMERGQFTWSGPAATLKDRPELLHQAYLAGEFHLTD